MKYIKAKKIIKENKYGLLYFYIHFAVEIICFYIIGNYFSFKESIILAFIYDFLAFVPQELIGYIYDKKIKINYFNIGVILLFISIICFYLKLYPYLVISILAIGNALIHVCGAEKTLRESNGKMTPSSLFVSGGSFGLIIGKILAKYNCNIIIILLLCFSILILYNLFCKDNLYNDKNIIKYDYHNVKINKYKLIILSIIVVSIRAYIGYGIPTSWNKTIIQSILLYFFMGFGKALGGILIDHIGIRKTIFISTLCSLPFLVFGDTIIYISLIGVMLFSATMSITLAILTSQIKKPGIAFGLTTIGLFLGTYPLFIFKISDKITNIWMIIILSIISFIILINISKEKEKKL